MAQAVGLQNPGVERLQFVLVCGLGWTMRVRAHEGKVRGRIAVTPVLTITVLLWSQRGVRSSVSASRRGMPHIPERIRQVV